MVRISQDHILNTQNSSRVSRSHSSHIHCLCNLYEQQIPFPMFYFAGSWTHLRNDWRYTSRKSKNDRQCNGLKYNQWSTKHYTENPRSSNTAPLPKKKKQSKKELMNRRFCISCCTSGTRCVAYVTNPVISHEWGKDHVVIMTNGWYPWSPVTHIFRNG